MGDLAQYKIPNFVCPSDPDDATFTLYYPDEQSDVLVLALKANGNDLQQAVKKIRGDCKLGLVTIDFDDTQVTEKAQVELEAALPNWERPPKLHGAGPTRSGER